MSLCKPLLALVMVSSVGFAGTAFATTPSNCTSDVDCAHGYTCQPSAVIATPTPACAPDADCKTTDVGGAGGASGVSVTLSSCQPGPCTADSDCGANMVCHTETTSACSGGTAPPPCPANTKCADPAPVTPPTCTTTTTSACAFRWQLPCSADAECGDGFVCQPSVFGSCSGGSPVSGGTSGSAGGSGSTGPRTGTPSDAPAVTVPPDMCTTTTSFPGSCHAAAATCATDTDCPANWLCQETLNRGAPVSGGAGGAPASGGGTTTATDVGVTTPKMCVAPYSPPVGAKDGGDGGRNGGSETGGSPDSPTGTGGSAAPTAGSATGTGGAHAGQDSKTPGASNDGGGCSVSPAAAHPGSGAAALLALFGLGLVVARRRRG